MAISRVRAKARAEYPVISPIRIHFASAQQKDAEFGVYLQSAPCYSFLVKVNTDSLKNDACRPPKD